MRETLSEPVSLAAMATEAGISRFHLLRPFKLTYGEKPFRRLTRLRIGEAQRRLLGSAESITEIAFSCGYDNPVRFAAAFRRHIGVAPSAYRRGTALERLTPARQKSNLAIVLSNLAKALHSKKF